MKGIILAGGSGTRLYPLTLAVSKQLMPVYDKPMIYYPLSTLIGGGIKDILIISTPLDLPRFKMLLGDGASLGCKFSYLQQAKPLGLAESFIIGSQFIANESVALILGDNIFYGSEFNNFIKKHKEPEGAVIFGYQVAHPEHYGVVEFDNLMRAKSITEKPQSPSSNYAIPGLYFFDNTVVEIAKSVTPSKRGELEITDIHNSYLKKNKLKVVPLDRGVAWLDTGTFHSLQQASQFVQVIEERQGFKIGCIEEVAYNEGLISARQLKLLAKKYDKSGYGEYLMKLLT